VNWIGGLISTSGLVVALLSRALLDRRHTAAPVTHHTSGRPSPGRPLVAGAAHSPLPLRSTAGRL
jgi:hypothetical protein